MNAHLFFFAAFALCFGSHAMGQQQFRLAVPETEVASNARLSERELAITDDRGQTTVYLRDGRFDSRDGTWIGFYARAAQQVIRWPAGSRGSFQIGAATNGTVRYRTSQMVIQPLGRVANRPVLPPLGIGPNQRDLDPLDGLTPSPLFNSVLQNQQAQSQLLQLVNFDSRRGQQYLAHNRANAVALAGDGSSHSQWWVVPAGRRFVRVQHFENGRVIALTANRGQALALAALSQDPRQLWHISSLGPDRRGYTLESAAYPHLCLGVAGGQVLLQPLSYAPGQMWVPLAVPVLPAFEPFWRTVSQQISPNPPLPPAELGLVNTHRHALLVLLADQRLPGKTRQIRIEPNQTATVTLDRDSGATLVETYEIRSPSGLWDRRQFSTPIPSQPWYDLSVYEVIVQSIAIDRTGKSPNRIQDINYMPKSVGWMQLPAGAQLPPSSTMDVLSEAKAANNPGGVRRMDMKQFNDERQPDPLESLLEEFKSAPRKGS